VTVLITRKLIISNRNEYEQRLLADLDLAQQLLERRLTTDTKPTEREARSAARRVLKAIPNCTPSTLNKMLIFLLSLADALDPDGVSKKRASASTRKIRFKNFSQGVESARAALSEHVDIALRVQQLRKAGASTRAAVSDVAEKHELSNRQVVRICKAPNVRQVLREREYVEMILASRRS
jgi:hypothetical protein